MSGPTAPPTVGNALPGQHPVGLAIHNLETHPGRRCPDGPLGRFRGDPDVPGRGLCPSSSAFGEIRLVHEACMATIGQVGNAQWENVIWARRGRGAAPRHPTDVPWHGAEPGRSPERWRPGKSKGGGGRQHGTSPWVCEGVSHPQPKEDFEPVHPRASGWAADETQIVYGSFAKEKGRSSSPAC